VATTTLAWGPERSPSSRTGSTFKGSKRRKKKLGGKDRSHELAEAEAVNIQPAQGRGIVLRPTGGNWEGGKGDGLKTTSAQLELEKGGALSARNVQKERKEWNSRKGGGENNRQTLIAGEM